MTRLITISLFFIMFLCGGVKAQNDTWQYEYERDIPIYIDSIQASLTYPYAYSDYKKKKSWRKDARLKVLECMGALPPTPSAWDMKVIAEERREGYVARKIEFALSAWYRVKAYLLVPFGPGKQPAVNLLHDHGAHLSIGKEKMIKPFAVDSTVVEDAETWAKNIYGGQFLGDYLARNGYVVFSIDAPLWGERGRKEGVDRKKYDIIAGNMMMAGQNLCAYMHYDDILSTEFLASLPFVDKDRIGAAGCSMGAYRAWMLSALSDRVKAGCAICWMITTKTQLTTKYGRKENGGFANTIPSLRRYMDYPDIASLASPKPMLFVSGSRDKLFPVPGVEDAYRKMHAVWDDMGASENLETYILDQPHECNLSNQKMILEFFNRNLRKQ